MRSRQRNVCLPVVFFWFVCYLNKFHLLGVAQLAIRLVLRNLEFTGQFSGLDRLSCCHGDLLDRPPRGLCCAFSKSKTFDENAIKNQSRNCKIGKIYCQSAVAPMVTW